MTLLKNNLKNEKRQIKKIFLILHNKIKIKNYYYTYMQISFCKKNNNFLIKSIITVLYKIYNCFFLTLNKTLFNNNIKNYNLKNLNKFKKEKNKKNKLKQIINFNENEKIRHPIVTIVGHVNHGKTTLIDAIRKTTIVQKEYDNITQHLNAYNVSTKYGKLTLIDTPGHEVFDFIRTLSINCADIILLLIAVDSGIKSQTLEVIEEIKKYKKTTIIVLNKCDKKEKLKENTEHILSKLAEVNVVSEKFGGDVITEYISAKNELGIDKLLQTIQLQAEILELKAKLNCICKGIVIETKIDKGLGIIVSVLVKEGLLNKGNLFVCGKIKGKIRFLRNSEKKEINKVKPSFYCEIVGLDELPQVGEYFSAGEIDEKKFKKTPFEQVNNKKNTITQNLNSTTINNIKIITLILKTDAFGTTQAIAKSFEKLSENAFFLKIIRSSIGNITDSDITLAHNHNAFIIGFNVKITNEAKKENLKYTTVETNLFQSIYKLIDFLEKKKESLNKKLNNNDILGNAIVKEIFNIDKDKKIAGCFQECGIIKKENKIKIIRDNKTIHTGFIKSLRNLKQNVTEIHSNTEFGIVLKEFNDYRKNDIISVVEKDN